MPHYNFEDFKRACGKDKSNVVPIGDVLKDASESFNLRTKTDLLNFISNSGLEQLKFVNSKNWEHNPDRQNPLIVDSYEFKSMFKLGYIAFMYNSKTKKWIIKSFHPSQNTNPIFRVALAKAGLLQ